MNKGKKTFVIQLNICIAVLVISMFSINKLFENTPDKEMFLRTNNNITNLRKSSTVILNNLITEDALTFDPTNGVSIEKVFSNLKVSNKRKILLLGSSQLVTVSGDKSFDNYKRRTDILLKELYNDEIIVYNLSLGGMTTIEKEIILKKAQELYKFDAIVVSIGPYDCRENDIRQGIQDLKTKQFAPKSLTLKENIELESDYSIQNFNNSIEENVTEFIEDNSDFYKNKSVIKSWLSNEMLSLLSEEKKLIGSGEPNGWKTYLQHLDEKTGWVNNELDVSSKVLKIINTEKTNANWKGVKINLKKPTNKIIFGVSSKCENAKEAKLYCLDVKVDFTDGTYAWCYKGLGFKQGTSDWQTKEKEFTFEKEIASVTPMLLFYGGLGTVFFDDIYAKPVYNGIASENILINSTLEEEKTIKDVHTISFDKKLWNTVFENSENLITFFGKNTSISTKKYILIPPVYTSVQKSGYEQKFYTDKFKANLNEICGQNGISVLDASKILNQYYFIEYESGKRKGMIEPLHFNAAGHKKLANFLFNRIEID